MRVRLASSTVGMLLCVAAAARAEPHVSARLNWRTLPGGEGCPDAAAVARAVESFLGRTVWSDDPDTDVQVSGAVGPQSSGNGGWAVHMEVRARDGTIVGERDLADSGPTCDGIAGTLSAVLALMVDLSPDRIREHLRPIPPPTQALAPAVQPAPVVVRWHAAAALAAAVSSGVVPGAALGVQAVLRIAPPHFIAAELGGVAWKKADVAAGSGGVEIGVLEGGLSLCPIVAVRRAVEWSACAAATVGRLTARGFGLDRVSTGTTLLRGVGVTATASLPAARALRVRVGATLRFQFVRPRLFYADGDAERTVYDTAPVAVMGTLGAAFSFL